MHKLLCLLGIIFQGLATGFLIHGFTTKIDYLNVGIFCLLAITSFIGAMSIRPVDYVIRPVINITLPEEDDERE